MPRIEAPPAWVSASPENGTLPAWVAPTPHELRDLSCLALCLLLEQGSRPAARLTAGLLAVMGWLRGQWRAPMTARPDGPGSRAVALTELCAAECRAGDGAPPPLQEVCELLGVAYRAPLDIDPGYACGAWLALRWALGETDRAPLDLPVRCPDGTLMDQSALYSELMAHRHLPDADTERAQLRRAAAVLAADSQRLADLVEDTARAVRRP